MSAIRGVTVSEAEVPFAVAAQVKSDEVTNARQVLGNSDPVNLKCRQIFPQRCLVLNRQVGHFSGMPTCRALKQVWELLRTWS